MPFVKICGIQTYEEAKAALDCGATALGFLVGLTHLAEDKISETAAKDIIHRLPKSTNTVLVTHLLDINKIASFARFMGVSTIQVHDEVTVADMIGLRSILSDKTLLKAVHVTGPAAVKTAMAYKTYVDGLVLDSRTKERLGGTGKVHDWSISHEIVNSTIPLPVYLAGGLTPDNVSEAIMAVNPAGVDVNSGVEDARGRKDRGKMTHFVTVARSALAQKANAAVPTPAVTQ